MTAPSDPRGYAASFDADVGPLIADAARRSRGFRSRLDALGVAAGEVTDVAGLEVIPVQTKDDVLRRQHADPPFGGLLADDVRPRRVFQSPGPIYEPELVSGDGWRWAPALAAAGFGADDVVLVTFGFHLSPAGAMFEAACTALGASVVPAGVGNKDLQVAACRDLGVTAYIGTPSYLKALFDTAAEQDTELALARAFVTAEPLPPTLRTWLEDRVPTVRVGYGTAETGHLGHECAERDGWHVPDDALVQVCDLTTGAALVDGSEGQLVVTLLSSAYPIVRFGTGDLSAWHTGPCPCGASTPRLRGWMGRVGDAVKVRGMFLHPRQVDQVLSRVAGVDAYRVVIERADHRDELRVEVVGGGDGVAERVADAVHQGLRFRAEVTVVEAIDADAAVLDDRRTWE
jgi:phenylacetate-CoA ligase